MGDNTGFWWDRKKGGREEWHRRVFDHEVVGLVQERGNQRWEAVIWEPGESETLGYYDTLDEAKESVESERGKRQKASREGGS